MPLQVSSIKESLLFLSELCMVKAKDGGPVHLSDDQLFAFVLNRLAVIPRNITSHEPSHQIYSAGDASSWELTIFFSIATNLRGQFSLFLSLA
jgi:hypothetical protein